MGERISRTRWHQRDGSAQSINISFSQPHAIEIYYSVCAKIDQHNCCRQDILNMEKRIETQSWAFRVNTSLLSMIIVDSWLVYSQSQENNSYLCQSEYYEHLATQLIDNNSNSGPEIVSQHLLAANEPFFKKCTKRRRRDGAETNHAMQHRCKKYSRKTTYFCSECDRVSQEQIYICHPGTGRSCFESHKNESRRPWKSAASARFRFRTKESSKIKCPHLSSYVLKTSVLRPGD